MHAVMRIRDASIAAAAIVAVAAAAAGSAEVHDALGDACWRAADRPRAVASYQRSLAIDPGSDHARAMIDVLR